MASGKLLYGRMIFIIGTGKVASKITYTGNDEEDRKLLITMLEDGYKLFVGITLNINLDLVH